MKNHTYWLGGTTTLAKTTVQKKKAKKDVKVWATRILVCLLALTFIAGTFLFLLYL